MTYSPEGMRLTDEGIDQEGIQDAEKYKDASEQNDFNFEDDMAKPNKEFLESVLGISEVAEEGFSDAIPDEWLTALGNERGGSIQIESAPE